MKILFQILEIMKALAKISFIFLLIGSQYAIAQKGQVEPKDLALKKQPVAVAKKQPTKRPVTTAKHAKTAPLKKSCEKTQ